MASTTRQSRKSSAARSVESRIYLRCGSFYWFDGRSLGLKRLALVAPGESEATTDWDTAVRLAHQLVEALEADKAVAAQRAAERAEAERRARYLGIDPGGSLAAFCDVHMSALSKPGTQISISWLDTTRRILGRAIYFFDGQQPRSEGWAERGLPVGARALETISTRDVTEWLEWLAQQPNGRGGVLGPQSELNALAVLGKLFKHAISVGKVQSNPVASVFNRPVPPRSSTRLMEAGEIALMLEAARVVQDGAGGSFATAAGFVCDLLTLLAYSGARWGEVVALDIQDVRRNLRDGVLEVVSSKTDGAVRYIPLSSHAVASLSAYVERTGRISGPLFATVDGQGEVRRLGDVRKTLRTVARLLGWADDAVRARRLRVSFASHYSACDGVSVHDVRDALGHASLAMLAKVYGRARKRRVGMGMELDFRLSRWIDDTSAADRERLETARASLLAGDDVAAAREARASAAAERRAAEQAAAFVERGETVRAFLAATEGLPAYTVAKETGIDRSAIRRARQSAEPGKTHGATVDAMRGWLQQHAPDRLPGADRPRLALVA